MGFTHGYRHCSPLGNGPLGLTLVPFGEPEEKIGMNSFPCGGLVGDCNATQD